MVRGGRQHHGGDRVVLDRSTYGRKVMHYFVSGVIMLIVGNPKNYFIEGRTKFN